MCTNFLITVPTDPGVVPAGKVHVTARCLELSGHMPTSLYRIARGLQFPLVKPPHRWAPDPASWTNKYGFVGIANHNDFARMPCFMDGLNERGLSIGALWLPGTQYPHAPHDSPPQVAFYDFGAWVLGQFETVDEVRAALTQVQIVGPKTPDSKHPVLGKLQDLESHYVPLHFIVTDAFGKSLVVEFVNGEITIYPRKGHEGETDDGVLTNAPTYDWQRTNLANYSHLSVVGAGTSVVNTSGPPVGNGLWGLPGDPMSASRFVKCVTLRQGFSLLPSDGQSWLPAPSGGEIGFSGSVQTVVNVAMQMVQVIQATPYGTALMTQGSSPQPVVGDYTMWAVVRDHTHRKLYFTTAFNGIMRVIDLDALGFDQPSQDEAITSLPLLPQSPSLAWCEDATTRLSSAGGGA